MIHSTCHCKNAVPFFYTKHRFDIFNENSGFFFFFFFNIA